MDVIESKPTKPAIKSTTLPRASSQGKAGHISNSHIFLNWYISSYPYGLIAFTNSNSYRVVTNS